MKTSLILFIIVGLFTCCNHAPQEGYPIHYPDLHDVTLSSGLLKQYQDTLFIITIPYAFEQCEETGRIANFAIAAGLTGGEHIGERYNDTDVFKIIEGACYKLMQVEDAELAEYVDSLAHLIAQAQEDDGYLFTSRTIDPNSPTPGAGRDRWIDVWVSHELYNAGHLYEAAVAHFKATGDSVLLKTAIKNADLVCQEFRYGGREIAPGHQEIEIGLVKLFQQTGDIKYLNQAQFFLDVRGRAVEHLKYEPGSRFAIYNELEYLQYHQPVLEQTEATGHAVRASYMYAGLADVGQLSGDSRYSQVSKTIWEDVINSKIYITGGIGAQHQGESFGAAYELPNETAYNETCAAIGNVFWNSRLFAQTGDPKYYDVLETSLYNGLLSGMALDGKHFFYPNPLESNGELSRSPWFGVACCPGNLSRFIAEMPKYIYAISNDTVWINLFTASSVDLTIKGQSVGISQETNYPFDGKVDIKINTEKKLDFKLFIRIPQWTAGSPLPGALYSSVNQIREDIQYWVNGKPNACEPGGHFLELGQKWSNNDHIILMLPTPVQLIQADARVLDNLGKLALTRGPLVYCIEDQDQEGSFDDIHLDPKKMIGFQAWETGLPNITGIQVNGLNSAGEDIKINALPYFSWNNRGIHQMKVWIPRIN